MKSLVAFAMLFLSTLLMAQSNATTTFHSNGAFAQTFSFTNGTDLFLQVNRGTDFTGSPATFLFYDSFTFSSDSFIDTFASGTIPNDAFTGGDPAHLVLNVDTTQVNTFFVETCTFSFTNFTFTCAPGALGVIQLEWQQNRAFSSHTTSDTQTTFAQAMAQQHIDADSASADVSGSFLGLPVSNTFAEAGASHNSTIQLVRTH
jgi:hypothetical protein